MRISWELREHVALIGLQRPEKRNAFDLQMLDELAAAYTRFEEEKEARCAVLFAHGDPFPGGLALAEVGPAIVAGRKLFPDGHVDPLGLGPRRRTKPVVCAL